MLLPTHQTFGVYLRVIIYLKADIQEEIEKQLTVPALARLLRKKTSKKTHWKSRSPAPHDIVSQTFERPIKSRKKSDGSDDTRPSLRVYVFSCCNFQNENETSQPLWEHLSSQENRCSPCAVVSSSFAPLLRKHYARIGPADLHHRKTCSWKFSNYSKYVRNSLVMTTSWRYYRAVLVRLAVLQQYGISEQNCNNTSFQIKLSYYRLFAPAFFHVCMEVLCEQIGPDLQYRETLSHKGRNKTEKAKTSILSTMRK